MHFASGYTRTDGAHVTSAAHWKQASCSQRCAAGRTTFHAHSHILPLRFNATKRHQTVLHCKLELEACVSSAFSIP